MKTSKRILLLRKIIQNFIEQDKAEDIFKFEPITRAYTPDEILDTINFIENKDKNKKRYYINVRLSSDLYQFVKENTSEKVRQAITIAYKDVKQVV